MFDYLTAHTFNTLDNLTPKLNCFPHTEFRYSFISWQKDTVFFYNGTAQLFSLIAAPILVTEDSCNWLIIQIFIYENVWETDKECADISESKQRVLINLIKLRQK